MTDTFREEYTAGALGPSGPSLLPWTVEGVDGRLVGLAADKEHAIETARLQLGWKPGWIINSTTNEAWRGSLEDWRRVRLPPRT